MKKLILVLFAISLVCGGCAAPSRIPLNESAIKSVTTIDAYIFLEHEELYVEIEKSNVSTATGGGLIPALIDVAIESSRTKDGERLVKPIRDSLIDFDTGQCIKGQVENGCRENSRINIGSVSVFSGTSKNGLNQHLKPSEENAILVFDIDFCFPPSFHQLKTNGVVHLFPNTLENHINFKDCIYKYTFVFTSSVDYKAVSREQAINWWTEDSGEHTRQAIIDGTVCATQLFTNQLRSR